MTKKNNQNKMSGQPARLSRKQEIPAQRQQQQRGSLGQPSMGAPVAFSSPTQNQRPQISANKQCTKVVHRELVATINGVTTFGSNAYALNPGVAASFPWLSTIASSFEQYTFKRLQFHYVTRCATSYVGSVLLAPEYDALDAAPTTEVNMAMMDGAREDVPWRDQVIRFVPQDMFPLGPRKFIRSGAIASTADLKTYDAGQLFVAMASCADTSGIGKLWVDYEVELYIPQNPNASQNVGVGSMAIYTLHAATNFSTGVATLVPFDTKSYDSIGVVNTAGSFVLPNGDYAVHAVVSCGDPTAQDFGGLLEVRKNGSASSPKYQSSCKILGSSNETFCLPVLGYVNSTGADAVSVYLTATGSGGPNSNADVCQIMIQRVA